MRRPRNVRRRVLHAAVLLPLRFAAWRYKQVARLVDYVDRRAAWYAALALFWACESAVLDMGAAGALIATFGSAGFLVWRSMTARFPDRPVGAIFVGTICFYELLGWVAAFSTAAAVASHDPDWVGHAGNALADAAATYMLIDLIGPPRKRKRVKVRMPKVRLAPAPSPA